MKRARKFLIPALALLVVATAWFEPTHCIRGWMRGEAFYQGRPTSYWREELQSWTQGETLYSLIRTNTGGTASVEVHTWLHGPRAIDCLLPRGWKRGVLITSSFPPLNGDSDARQVLEELRADASPEIVQMAQEGLNRILMREYVEELRRTGKRPD